MESATSRDVAGGPGSRTAGPPVDAPGGARAGGAARTGDTGAGESSRGGARPAGPRNLMVTALAGIRGAAEALRPGQRFADRYRVEAMIGAGATGVVFRVYDVETEERRALKVLRPDVALTDPHALARLAREARTAGALAHPNIVRTYELGESDGLHFLTMEYVEGTTLRELLDRGGPLPIDAAVTSVRQLCRALAYAHKQGVVHRDVKPHNAVVSPSGVLRVMDFGIARFAGAPSGITETGVLIGTPAYMAPEVLRGATADVRSDVYGTGAVLYECLTGRPPFGDASGVQALVVLTQVLEEAPGDPRALRPEVPEGLAQVVLAALAKDATRRPQSAEELGERLAPYA
jgi:serine/threonine-protein kinase